MATTDVEKERCARLRLTVGTQRRLWSESGGFCQSPTCGDSLFEEDADIDFAQMAHIVGASSSGPRGTSELTPDQRAHHSNITVLCPKCHILIDRLPDEYPLSTLQQWKARHQGKLQQAFGIPEFANRRSAREFIEPMLAQNRTVFGRYGPRADEFSEERANLWRLHSRRTIVPNNQRILRALRQNRKLLTIEERATADLFELHVVEFDARHVLNDWSAGTQQFPSAMDFILEERLDRA